MNKILVFGALGNTGLYLTEYLANHLDKSEYQIIAVGRRNSSYYYKRGVPYYQVDITNAQTFFKLPKDNIYCAVNLAGVLPAKMQDDIPEKYVLANVLGTLNILQYLKDVKANRFLFAQSWADYDGYIGTKKVLEPNMPRKLKYTGDHAVYSITKCAAVDMMEYYHQTYDIRNFVFRMPNIYMYTPDMYYYLDGKETIVPYRYMISRAIQSLPLELWGDPKKAKDIVYVKDFCQLLCKAIIADIDGGTYNVGTGKTVSMQEQIEGIIKVFSPNDNPSEIIYCPEKHDCVEFVMDIENARRELGYQPRYDYLSYLEDYKEEMKSNRFEDI